MAAFPYADPALLPRESPRHKVRVTKSFYMGQYEVTLGQFKTSLARRTIRSMRSGMEKR